MRPPVELGEATAPSLLDGALAFALAAGAPLRLVGPLNGADAALVLAAARIGDALAHLFRERIQRRTEERGPLAARAQGRGGEDRVFELRHGGERPAAAPRPLWMRQRHPLGLGDHAVRPQLAGGGLGSPQRIVVAALRRRGHHAHLAQDAPVDELERGERGRGVERSDDLPVLPVEAG